MLLEEDGRVYELEQQADRDSLAAKHEAEEKGALVVPHLPASDTSCMPPATSPSCLRRQPAIRHPAGKGLWLPGQPGQYVKINHGIAQRDDPGGDHQHARSQLRPLGHIARAHRRLQGVDGHVEPVDHESCHHERAAALAFVRTYRIGACLTTGVEGDAAPG